MLSLWPIVLPIVGALSIQLRLLCNLLDGMVAVEGGLRTNSGEIFNDLPDRVSDSLIFVAAGYSMPGHPWAPIAGWAAALVANLTAYIRVLGVSAGTKAHFEGPMAKPHRMALMTVACIGAAVEAALGGRWNVMAWALGAIVVGSVVTAVRRSRRIVRELESP